MTTTAATQSEKVFSLAGKNLKLTTEEDIAPYLEELRAVKDVEEIHLGGNTLGVGACQALGKVLQEQTQHTLRIADFADIFTGRLISEIPDALRALCDSLVEHTALQEINLSDNAFGGRSAEPMVNFLTNNHSFAVLKLNNNGLGITGGEIVANALLAAAEKLQAQGKQSALRTVICGRNRLEDGSAPFWAKAYAAHKNLEEVRMFQNGIRMDGTVALAQGLSACANLKVLDLQDNTATLRGSRGIAASLPNWPKLEVLNLNDCLLKPKGGYLVIDALHKANNVSLKTLQLQYCDLDRKALSRLGSAIDGGALKNVELLEINGNWADEEDECIEQIKAALAKHGHEDALEELDEMDPEGEEEDEQDDQADESEKEDAADVEATPAAQAAASTEPATKPAEVAAAAVAAPAATLAVAGGAAVAAASHTQEAVNDKLKHLSVNDEPQADTAEPKDAQDSAKADAVSQAQEAEQVVKADAAETKETVQDPATATSNVGVKDQESRLTTAQADKDFRDEENQESAAGREEQVASKASEAAPSAEDTVMSGSEKKEQVPTTDDNMQDDAKDTEKDASLAAVGLGGAGAAVAGGVAAAAASAGLTKSSEGDSAEQSKAVGASGEAAPASSVEAALTSAPAQGDVPAVQAAQEPAGQADDLSAAQNAAEVSESVQEVPEPKESAEIAADVAESAQEVPEPKEASEIAAEVAQSADEVPDERAAAETADEVDEIAKQVPEKQSGQATPIAGSNEQNTGFANATEAGVAAAGAAGAGTAAVVASHASEPASEAMETKPEVVPAAVSSTAHAEDKQTSAAAPETAAASASTMKPTESIKQAGHGQQPGSVDLSGELYGDEGTARSPAMGKSSLPNVDASTGPAVAQASVSGNAGPSQPQLAEGTATGPSSEQEPKKKKGFRAAFGAIRELLR